MKIKSGKFVMLAITCIMFGNLDALRPYKNATIKCDTEEQHRDTERYAHRIGVQLVDGRVHYETTT